LLALLAAASMHAETPPVQGTMPEDYLPGLGPLLKTAVERSPNTIMASITLAQQEAQKYVYAYVLWPSINGNISYTGSSESVSQGPTSNVSGVYYNAGINQPIFQWLANKNNAEIGTLGVKIAERQYAEAYRLLAIQIREQYMYLIGKKITLRNARYRQMIAQEALATQKAKFEAGSSSEAEVQGVSIAFDQAQLDADRFAEDYAYGKRVFTRLVGIDALDEESIPIELVHPEYSAVLADAVLAGFVADGAESNFQSEVYKMTIKQQDLNYSIAKVRLLPKFNAAVNYSLSDQSTAFSGHVSQVAVQDRSYSIAANWTIFDGFLTRGEKLQALETKRFYERTRQTYIDNTIDTMGYLRRQIGLSSRALALAELHNALIAAEVRRINDDLKLGFASPATVETSNLNLYGTQFDQANARTDFLSKWTEFVSLAGVDPAIANISTRYVR
jgi:outer membrane protein TolC